MRDADKSLDKFGLLKFGITTLVFIDFIRRTFESAIAFDSIGMMVSIVIVSVLALGGFKNEFKNVQIHNRSQADQSSTSEKLKTIITYIFVSIATYSIATLFDINATFAASIVVLLMVFFIDNPFKIFQGAVYTGTFTGMVSEQFISSWFLALLFSFVGSLLFLFFQPSYRATGGRAGLNAYMTSIIFIFIFSDVKTSVGSPLNREMILFSFIFLVGSAFVAYILEEHTALSGVQSAMLVTFFLNLFIPSKFGALITAGFTGSFMGTTGSDRIKNLRFLFLVELFTFLLFVPAYPLLAGIGGKLGIITLIGYMAADGTRSVIESFRS